MCKTFQRKLNNRELYSCESPHLSHNRLREVSACILSFLSLLIPVLYRGSMGKVWCFTAGSVWGKYGASQQGQYVESMVHHTGYQQVSVRAFRFGRYLL